MGLVFLPIIPKDSFYFYCLATVNLFIGDNQDHFSFLSLIYLPEASDALESHKGI